MLDDRESAILFLLEEPHSSVHVKLVFFFFLLPERKVIEMSEKEPGSLEKLGSLKCQRRCSSSNIFLHFRYSPG